jgi:predicted SprT family Zn-dependent metalloprotease
MPPSTPTTRTYNSLEAAYDFFNDRLFGGKLPPCLITMQRSKKAYGYFAGGRFGAADGSSVTDEIALNPSHFRDRTTEQSLSTLVHEMTHLEQHHAGKPSRGGYHNKEWAGLMKAVGLMPSDTAAPGGRETGQQVSHYIDRDGPFSRACAELISKGFDALYVELWNETGKAVRKKKAASKTRYSCPGCAANAWAKPGMHLICGACDRRMEPFQDEEVGERQAGNPRDEDNEKDS